MVLPVVSEPMLGRPILLIGGYPKGFDEPFDVHTKSGRILRSMLEKAGRPWILLDLWNNREEELEGKINEFARRMIVVARGCDYEVFALGHYVEKRLDEAGLEIPYAPHPASRRPQDLVVLESVINGITSKG